MDFFFLSHLKSRFRKNCSLSLGFCWVCGLVFGMVTAIHCVDSLIHLMNICLLTPVSIGYLMPVMLVPFFLSALGILLRKQAIVCTVCFLKAFLLSYHGYLLCSCFSFAGWILVPLLFFSDWISSVILWMFWVGCVRSGYRDMIYRVIPALAAVFLTCSLDCSFVSPFLGAVLS